MKKFLSLAICALTLSACSPHPGSGVWKAQGENNMGIPSLTIGFEGKARFSSSKTTPATWHCFWNASGRQTIDLDCTPSIDTEAETHFVLTVTDNQAAKLSMDGKPVGNFARSDKMPKIQ
jgi:hypothetical protein